MIETPSLHSLSDPLELSDAVLNEEAAATPAYGAPISELLAYFREQRHFIVVSHARPDGDAIGSVLAMGEILNQLGCTTELVLADSAPAIYRSLPGLSRINFTGTVSAAPGTPAILLECDGIERTGLKGLEGRPLINIDHHVSGRNFGAINWIDPQASAVAVMVYRIAVAAGVEITPSMATCIYAALLSDTGAFTYPNTTPESFAIAHDLTLRGANPARIARDLYFASPLSKVRLLGRALDRLEIRGSLAWSWVMLSDLESVEATAEDCEGIVGNLIAIDGIEAAFFLREQADGLIRASIRSKGDFDVSRVAEAFHGGGHRNASGCTLASPMPSAIDAVLAQLSSAGMPTT
ncbi:phosphoesterase RecJ-like protein [Granulicella aggregans]|uniref:Phosphoesterase RecJ-like protein n=1 Tax=Granulicella aggregans TaxID=474949 RepID=A0A7W7ZA23_9BACT|nr:bifunctional oligoribonuclease/PAP phosphatase NrnA [Granulicella aggregans]MBB5055829.1 phosphoesterase RecJ-like protein [Granulicella aggregans]